MECSSTLGKEVKVIKKQNKEWCRIWGGPGLDGFKEPSLEDLVEMVRQGKIGKEVLGDRADEFLEYGTPSQREKQLKDTGSLEIPIQNYIDAERKLQMMPDARQGPDEDDLAFLKDFISRRA